MSDLKATEFDEILGGDFEIPCYVNMEESFKHAIAIGRPIVVLYGEEAAIGMKEFEKIDKDKKWFNINDKLTGIMRKLGFAITVISFGGGAPIMFVKQAVGVAVYGFLMKYICYNKELFKDYNLILDRNNDRVVFLKKTIKSDNYPSIMSQIINDFNCAITELVDNFDNIFKVTDVFTITKRGTVLYGKVLKGNYIVGDTVKVVDSNLIEYAIDNIADIEIFRKRINKVSVGEECGLLIMNHNVMLESGNNLVNEIKKQKLLFKDIYVVR